MNVELPSTGCNVISGNNTFYNYSPNSRTRETYVIYDGVAHLQSVSTTQTGYSYTGDCLHTGDLVYKPELEVWFPLAAFFVISLINLLIYKIIIKRLMP